MHFRSAPQARDAAGVDRLDVAVVRLPRISNFTDLDPLTIETDVEVRMVTSSAIGDPDLLIVPGTKSTVADLEWMRARGLDRAIVDVARRPLGSVVLGICGGYQMLGRTIQDDVESRSRITPRTRASGREHNVRADQDHPPATWHRTWSVTERVRDSSRPHGAREGDCRMDPA